MEYQENDYTNIFEGHLMKISRLW